MDIIRCGRKYTTNVVESKCAIKVDLSCFGPNGFIFPQKLTEWEKFIREMSVSDNDVWLLSFPRSGNTWAGEMAWLLLNNLNFDEAKNQSLRTRMPFLESDTIYDIPTQGKETTMEVVSKVDCSSPRLIKSHLPLSLLPQKLLDSKAKIIYVERNPKDVCVSFFHLMELFFGYTGSLNEFADAFLDDLVPHAPYWNYVKEFHAVRNHPNVLCLKYEEIKLNFKSSIRQIADFLGKALTPEEMTRLEQHGHFDSMRSNDSTNYLQFSKQLRNLLGLSDVPAKSEFIRKGIVGSWKEEMSKETIRKFDVWIADNSLE